MPGEKLLPTFPSSSAFPSGLRYVKGPRVKGEVERSPVTVEAGAEKDFALTGF